MKGHLGFILSWTPVLLVFILAVFFRTRAITLAVWGFLYTVFIVALFFKTSPEIILIAALDGVLTTFPLLLVVYFGILLSVFLLEKGSLQRLSGWLAGGNKNPVNKSLLLSVGVGNFLEGSGVIAEPVAAPMIRASGIPPASSAALSIIGYSGLMHLSLAGVIITVLVTVSGIPQADLVRDLGVLSFPAVFFLCLSMPFFVKSGWGGHSLFLMLTTGAVASLSAFLTARYLVVPITGMMAGIGVVVFFYLITRQFPYPNRETWKDIAPFTLIIICLGSVNLIQPLRDLVFNRLAIGVSLIPGHTICIRPFFDAYTFIFLAFLLAFRLHGGGDDTIRSFLVKSSNKAFHAVAAMALFGAMGQVIAYSGYGKGFENHDVNYSMPLCLAQGLVMYTGKAYPLFAPLLGWTGTFLTGYGVASIMLFAKLQVETASIMGIAPSFLVSALAVGASIGSVSSPFKIAIATPLCGAEGQEGEILRKTIPLGLAVSLAVGIVTLVVTW